MISKRDSKPLMVKFPIGVSKTTKSSMQYEDNWITLYGLISEPSGSIFKNEYGNETRFDKIITLNAGSVSRAITYDTIFMLDDIPTSNFKLGNYYPEYIYPEYNGEIVIGLTKVEAIPLPKLYFFRNDSVLYYQINFDSDKLVAYIPNNARIPFKTGDYVWTREPTDSTNSNHRLRILSVSSYKQNKHFNEITFVGG